MDRTATSFAFGQRAGTMTFGGHSTGAGSAQAHGLGFNSAESIIPIATALHYPTAASGPHPSISSNPMMTPASGASARTSSALAMTKPASSSSGFFSATDNAAATSTNPALTSTATLSSVGSSYVEEGSTHALGHSAAFTAVAKMSVSGAIVVVAGDQSITCFLDSSFAAASRHDKANDCFSNAAIFTDTYTASGFSKTHAPSTAESHTSRRPIPSAVSSYAECVSLTGAGGHITSLVVEPVATEADVALGVVGLSNGKVVPFLIVGPGNRSYVSIARGNTGLASLSATSAATGFLKPRMAVLPYLDLSAATSRSVGVDEPVVSVAIGGGSTNATATVAASDQYNVNSGDVVVCRSPSTPKAPELIAAATANCVALFSCSRLFCPYTGLGGSEMLIAALFGTASLSPACTAAGDDSTDNQDDKSNSEAESKKEQNAHHIAVLAALPSLFCYKGFNVYASGNVMKIKAIAGANLRRVFLGDCTTSADDMVSNDPRAHKLHRGGNHNPLLRSKKTRSANVEIVASAVLAIILEDGSMRFIGRCVNAEALLTWKNSSAFSSMATSASNLTAHNHAQLLPSSPSSQRVAGRKGHRTGPNQPSSFFSAFFTADGGNSTFSASAAISRSTALHPIPLSPFGAASEEHHYIALDDAVSLLKNLGSNNSSGSNPSSDAALVVASTSLGRMRTVDSSASLSSPLGLGVTSSGAYSNTHNNYHGGAHSDGSALQTSVCDTVLNDAELFYNASTGLLDAVAVGSDIIRAAAQSLLAGAASSSGSHAHTATTNSGGSAAFGPSPSMAVIGSPYSGGGGGGFTSQPTALGGAFGASPSMLLSAPSFSAAAPHLSGSGYVTVPSAAHHPNPIAQTLGLMSVACSVVHGSVFRTSNSNNTSGTVVDVDVALPMPQRLVKCRTSHYRRLGHARADRRAFSIVRVVADANSSLPSTSSECSSPCPLVCLLAAGSELFFTPIVGSSCSTDDLAAPPTASSAPSLQYLCGFGGPIQDIQILSINKIMVPVVAPPSPNDTNASRSYQHQPEHSPPVNMARRHVVTAVIALSQKIHVIKCTF